MVLPFDGQAVVECHEGANGANRRLTGGFVGESGQSRGQLRVLGHPIFAVWKLEEAGQLEVADCVALSRFGSLVWVKA